MIYLDNAATTKPKKEIIDAFLAIENQYYANPSSIHSFGMKTNSYLEKARKQLSKLDNSAKRRILDYMDDVARLKNPRERGKMLIGNMHYTIVYAAAP